MARARYGGERGAGPLAAGLTASGRYHRRAATASPRRAVGRRDDDPAGRHAPARQARELAHPRAPRSQTYHEMFRAYPFTVLQETDDTLVSGLCGRIWTLARDYPALDGAEAFADWDEPGTVRVAFAHWAEPLEDGRAQLSPRRAWTRSTPPPACG